MGTDSIRQAILKFESELWQGYHKVKIRNIKKAKGGYSYSVVGTNDADEVQDTVDECFIPFQTIKELGVTHG